MPEIANLIIKFKGEQLQQAVVGLEDLSVSASVATESVKQLEQASRSNAKGTNQETAAIDKNTNARKRNAKAMEQQSAVHNVARGQARRVERLATGYDPRTGQMARDLGVNRFNTANIAAQFQDIGVTAAMGMNPMTIALQQGTQLSAILNNMGNPIKGLAQAIKQLLNPVALLSIGITGVVAALIQMVNWGKAVDGALDFLTDNISAITLAVLFLGTAFLYVQRLSIANWLLTALRPSFAALALQITVTAATMTSATTTAITLSGVLKLLGAAIMVPVKALGLLLLPFIKIGFIVAGIVGWIYVILELTGAMDYLNKKLIEYRENRKVKERDDFWKETSQSIEREINALKVESKFIGQSKVFREGVRKGIEVYNKALDKNIDLTSEQIDQLIKSSMEYAKLRNEMSQREEFFENKSSFLEQLEKENKALLFQSSLLGKTETEIEKLSHREELRNRADEKGLLGDVDIEREIENNSRLYNQLTDNKNALSEYNRKVNEAKGATTSFFTDMNHALIEGQTLWEAFGNAVTNVLTKILDKITQIGVDQLFAAGKASGWFGFGSKGTQVYASTAEVGPFLPQATGGVWSNGIRKFATGGVVGSATLFGTRNGLGLMGEAGPEAIMPLTRGANGELGVKAEGVGGSPVVVNVINNSNAKATVNQRQTSQGTEIDVMIDQLVADKLGTLGTASNTAMNTWNNRQLIAR